MEKLGERLLKLRKEAGLSQEEVADKLGVSRQTISKWETDQSVPDLDKIVPICTLYNIGSDELLTGNKPVIKTEIEIKEDNGKKRALGTSIAVLLYIMSFVTMIFIASVLKWKGEIAFSIAMIIIAIATAIIIYSNHAYKETKKEKKQSELYKILDKIISIVTVIAYFIISFKTGAWHLTWLLFIVYALVMQIVRFILFLTKGEENEE